MMPTTHESPVLEHDPASTPISTWMRRYVAGDERALRHLHDALAPRLRRTIELRLADGSSTDDVMQQVFVKAHESRDRFRFGNDDPDRTVLRWYRAIARHTAIDETRKRDRRRKRHLALERHEPADLASERTVDPESAALAREHHDETVARVRNAVASLAPHHRQILELQRLRGLSTDEVARVLDLRPVTVRVRAHRARQRLAEALLAG